MYKIMSNQCTYSEINYETLEPTILVEESVIWDNQETDNIQEAEEEHFSVENDTLAETVNESYMTANSNNTTQYFSVLDSTNQTILNDISDVTINNSIVSGNSIEEDPQSENAIDINNGQVVLFKVDGSEDLYGFQLIHDEEGNLQKYQFKVTQNIEGNLEAIPETLQILPVENEVENIVQEPEQETVEQFENATEHFEDPSEFQEENIPPQQAVYVKQEHFLNEEQSTPDFDEEEEIFEEQVDTKEGILDITTPSMQKQEIQEETNVAETHEFTTESQDFPENMPEEGDEEEEEEVNHLDEVNSEDQQEVYYTHEDVTLINENFYQNDIQDHPIVEGEAVTVNPSDEHYEELFVKESHILDDMNSVNQENGQNEEHLNESDNEEYETVDGVHVTGDVDENLYQNSDIRKSPSYQRSTIASRKKIIRNVIRKVRIQRNEGKANLYYLIKNTEKENVGQAPSNSITTKPNPRSILKCSIAAVEPIKLEEEEEEKYDKRFAKSKEAQQARQFHNFIAQTKIIHAPVRQERLPRKQQIKPMTRTDEEIVVQEVVVSSNGFIETSEEGVLKERIPLKPTEFIHLTDSDDDFDPRSPHKKKRRNKKRKPIEITISDSEENSSEKSIIEDDENNIQIPKRPRGRPPKQSPPDNEEERITKRPRGRPPKHPKYQPVEEEIIYIKIDNRCPQCPKSFPSEGSLRSHMQYHNFSQTKSNDAKYICEKCGDTFKNNFLLNRHINSHKTNNISCGICKKIFKDQAELSGHKRMHIKEKMFKTTTLLKDSPKCVKIQKKINVNKCENCGQIFDNISALNIHKKQHENFTCQTCRTSFSSKFTLGNHIRNDCVKKRMTSPKKRINLSLNVKKINPPKMTRYSTMPPQQENEKIQLVKPIISSSNNKVITNIKCDSCSMTFATYTSLYKHKVFKHGLDTPDETILENDDRKSVKRKIGHGGVPPSEKLKKAYMGLRSKLKK